MGLAPNEKMTSAEVDFHQRKIEEIWQDFSEFNQKLFKFYDAESDKLRELAKHYEALVTAGILDLTMNEICAYIINHKDELELDISEQWIRRVLDRKYKRDYDSDERKHVSNATIAVNNNGESVKHVEGAILKKPIERLEHHEAIEALKQFKRDADTHSSQARYDRDVIQKIQELGEQKKWVDVAKAYKPVTTPKPGSREGVFYTKLLELGEGILAYANKVKEYPASPEDDIRYGQAVDSYVQQLRYLNDLKFTKGPRGWMDTIKTAIVGHKHEAAVIHKVVATVPIETEDMETLEKTTEMVSVSRNLTREAVGDNIEPVLAAAIQKINAEFFWEAVEDHHDNYIEPYVGIRKELKHDDLSEKRFGGGGNLGE